jgi:hypothetical protein
MLKDEIEKKNQLKKKKTRVNKANPPSLRFKSDIKIII